MLDRFVGLETEYVLRYRPRHPGGARVANKELFERLVIGLRARCPLAPSIGMGQNGWFLANGGGYLSQESLMRLAKPQDALSEGDGLGWRVELLRAWAKGPVLEHEGSSATV